MAKRRFSGKCRLEWRDMLLFVWSSFHLLFLGRTDGVSLYMLFADNVPSCSFSGRANWTADPNVLSSTWPGRSPLWSQAEQSSTNGIICGNSQAILIQVRSLETYSVVKIKDHRLVLIHDSHFSRRVTRSRLTPPRHFNRPARVS